MSDSEVFPEWMVQNGETWTVAPDSFRAQLPDGVAFLGDMTERRETAMVVVDGAMTIVGEPGGWGWTSLACGSDRTGWVNLVVHDYRRLVGALQSARGHDSNVMPAIEEMFATPIGYVDAGITFGDIIREASNMSPDASPESALIVLEQTAAAWEALFQRFGITEHRTHHEEISMLMYHDNMQTYALLEDARFLDLVDMEAQSVTSVDIRISSALSRLRRMTSTLAPGFDVDKRCWEAVAGHIERRPAMRAVYGLTEPDLPGS